MKNILATSILCVTIGLVAAGCGGSDTPSPAATREGDQTPAAAGPGRAPGSGKVTDVTGSTAQVQSASAQVAVSWTDKTTFTKQVSAKASAVTVGSCVMVTSAERGEDASMSEVAAGSILITEATDGSCAVPGGGGRPEGAEGERPTDMPTDMPSGAPGGGQRGGFAVGEVTAVTDSGFTVESAQPGADDSSATAVAVTTSAGTTYTTTASGTAADVEVGVCVTSRGESDDTGAVTATTIAVSQPVDDECGGGFGGGAGRP